MQPRRIRLYWRDYGIIIYKHLFPFVTNKSPPYCIREKYYLIGHNVGTRSSSSRMSRLNSLYTLFLISIITSHLSLVLLSTFCLIRAIPHVCRQSERKITLIYGPIPENSWKIQIQIRFDSTYL